MKSSEILREAARLVELNQTYLDDIMFPRFGCYAICSAKFGLHVKWHEADENSPGIQDEMRYFKMLKPETSNKYLGWFGCDQDHRIVGLCLAAAIAESEGD